MTNNRLKISNDESIQDVQSLRPLAKEADVTVVIPVFNEAENILPLYSMMLPVLDSSAEKIEVLFVEDGSIDETYQFLKEIHERDKRIGIIRFRRNFGQTAAFSAGFDLARGDVIITMDGDLQNDPANIPDLLEKINQGYDVVSGWRVDRKDAFLTRRLPSIVANKLISVITGVKLHDYGCSLKAYRREVVKNVQLYGELHRFIPALASWMGIRVAEVQVNHSPRKYGRTKYGLGRVIKVILDLLTVKFLLGYATRPIHIFGLLGMISFSVGTVIGAYLSVLKIFFSEALSDRPLLLLAVLLVVLGVQLITMGLLGEIVVRTYHETQNKPIYVIREVLDTNLSDLLDGQSQD
ncbi:MAG: glycosyltransferase family 2 protein [Anaerolineales bacterium]